MKGREEPGVRRINWCEGQGGARGTEDSHGVKAGRSPGYGGSYGVKGREEPGVRRIYWCEGREKPGVRRIRRCKGQGGARGSVAPLV